MNTTVAQHPEIDISHHPLIGRGARESARLTRDWFDSLTEVSRRGESAAYVFVLGSLVEVLRNFDMPIVFPEIGALQHAVRGTAEDLLKESEDYGYSPDICGYLKADVAMHLKGREHPMGQIPKSSLIVTTNGCNTYFKWAECWERMYDTPIVTIDVPYARAANGESVIGDREFKFEVAYVSSQIKELIAECERVTKKKFDIDKFRETLHHSNVMAKYYLKVLDLNANRPAVFGALTDGLAYLGMVNTYRGTAEGARYFQELYEEMEFRVKNGIGAISRKNGKDVVLEQKFRLGLLGGPCYPIFRSFNEFFTDWGGIFVNVGYGNYASGGLRANYEFDLQNPIESYAEGTLLAVRNTQTGILYSEFDIESEMSKFGLDGIVYHGIKSCRTASSGLADRRIRNAQTLGLPSLMLESDIVDPRAVSKAQMKNRADAFFEGMISRQQKTGAAN
ncbi:MAG: 2-hydroxyacyl-CoA dehydratase family protein [Pseudomonadota bacterium]